MPSHQHLDVRRVRVTGHALTRWQERMAQPGATAADVERSFRGAALVYFGREVAFATNMATFVNRADGVTFGVDWSRYHRCVIVRTVMADR